jgi:hypothetical protein
MVVVLNVMLIVCGWPRARYSDLLLTRWFSRIFSTMQSR